MKERKVGRRAVWSNI